MLLLRRHHGALRKICVEAHGGLSGCDAVAVHAGHFCQTLHA